MSHKHFKFGVGPAEQSRWPQRNMAAHFIRAGSKHRKMSLGRYLFLFYLQGPTSDRHSNDTYQEGVERELIYKVFQWLLILFGSEE